MFSPDGRESRVVGAAIVRAARAKLRADVRADETILVEIIAMLYL